MLLQEGLFDSDHQRSFFDRRSHLIPQKDPFRAMEGPVTARRGVTGRQFFWGGAGSLNGEASGESAESFDLGNLGPAI